MPLLQKIKRFFEPFKSNIFAVILSILKFTCWALYSLFSVYIIREIIRLYTLHNMVWIEWVLYQFILFSIIFFIAIWFLRKSDWPILYHDMDKWIYHHYLDRLMQIESTYLEKLGTGRLIAIISTWEKTWIDWLSGLLKEWTKIFVVTMFILFLLFSKSIFYGLSFIGVFIILQIIVVYLDTLAHRYRKIRTERKSDFMRQLVRIIMSRNEILQSDKVDDNIENIIESIEWIRDSNNSINRVLFIIFNVVRMTVTILKIIFIVFLIFAGNDWVLSVADVAGFLALFIIFESFLIDSVEFYKNLTKDFSDIEKLWEVFDNAPKNVRYHQGKNFVFREGNFELQNISFTYNTQENMVFDDFSLSLVWGKKTAIVGHSGSGKTTLMKMLAGYIEPMMGKILIDGKDFSEIALKTYYPHIGYLTQDPSVFDATIRQNLMSVMTQESGINIEKQLIKALKLAQCDFVFDLEKKLDTEIWERWVRLSGWQKQRLAIAKIFLKNPEIILLDEPTSALDSFSEEAITIALDELFQWRTVIIIAHRLQTVKKSDEIIVLEKGKIVQRGNHNSLVEQWWVYAKMLELQSGF